MGNGMVALSLLHSYQVEKISAHSRLGFPRPGMGPIFLMGNGMAAVEAPPRARASGPRTIEARPSWNASTPADAAPRVANVNPAADLGARLARS